MPIDITRITYSDIAERETEARAKIENDISRLEARREKLGGLSAADQAEYERVLGLDALKDNEGIYVDPLFASVRYAVGGNNGDFSPLAVGHDSDGMLSVPGSGGERRGRCTRLALVLGMLQNENSPLPPLVAQDGDTVVPDTTNSNWPKFYEQFYRILGKAAGNLDLAVKVLAILAEEGNQRGDGRLAIVSTLEFARVMEKLIARGINASEAQLSRRVNESLNEVQDVGEDRPMHEIGIVLPDLDAAANYTIVEDHIRLAGPMIFASMFEELKAFEAVDTLIDMSQRGMLNLGRGPAGTKLYEYWRNAPNRMSPTERSNFYAITLGIPGGAVDGMVNTDFQDLWLRFVSSVSSLIRENRVDQLIRSSLPASVNQQQVKKAARDLTTNLSMHGYGMSFYAAVDLQSQIQEMIDLLSDEQMRAQFGAHDMWGVLDYVAQSYLGGARNSSKYRTLATCGAIITTWLADHVGRLRDPTAPMIDLKEVENPPARASGESATSKPTDYDLVNACELWLADMAASDQRIEEMSQPREAPTGPSRPIQIPSVAQDLLDQAGIGLGMSAGNNGNRPRGNGGGGGYVGY
ncbi:MAG TPA: hypothetical protein VK472_01290 [Allosphingosinicella sp.]|nr:hypothetical protein [Allosphingosinicella sp.]